MSVEAFCRELPSLPVRKNDRDWFPRWIRRYAGGLRRSKTDALPVGESEVIHFLQSLRDHGVPAWQRLQAARAVEAYRQHILKTDQPSLATIKQTLQRLAAQERDQVSGAAGEKASPQVVGPLPAHEAESVRQLRTDLRRLGYKYDTEKAYVGWIKRFMKHCKSPDLGRFGETEIRTFLTALAVEADVASSTQRQAKTRYCSSIRKSWPVSLHSWMQHGQPSPSDCR